MTIPAFVWTILAVLVTVALLYLFLTRTALGRGFKVLLRQMQRTPVTTQYPDEKREPQPRFHGRHQLNRYEDGLEKCIGCELCAWACPADAIFVQGADNTVEARFSPGERYASDYQINYNRCIFCAMCIEACPTRALTMTHEYEMSADSRAGLIYTKERLLAPLPEGGEPTPQRDEDVRARGTNYYGGLAATPPELHGGGYAAAGPRPMRRASEWLGPLHEREVTAPADADRDGLVASDQRSIPLGRDESHLREAKGHVDTPFLDQDEAGGTRRSDRSIARPSDRDPEDGDGEGEG